MYWCPVDLVLNKHPQEKSSDVRSGNLAGHVMYGDPLPVHFAGNCSSKNLRTNLTSVVELHLSGKLLHQEVEAQHTAATHPGTSLPHYHRDAVRTCLDGQGYNEDGVSGRPTLHAHRI